MWKSPNHHNPVQGQRLTKSTLVTILQGLRHNYAPDGITTYLNLAKDSIAMQ